MKHKSLSLLVLTLVMLASCGKQPSALQVGSIARDTILGVPCQVYTPYNYAVRSDEIFPVLYLQHGMYGSEDDWSVQGFLLEHMDSLLQLGEVVEMVVIMPDNFLGSMTPEERAELMARPDITPDGEAFDTSKGSAHWHKLTREQERSYEMSGYWENHFADFMAEVESRYRVSTDPKHRAIAGLSMGGYHTRQVSQTLPGQFAYIGLFSALVTPPYSMEGNEDALYWIGMGNEDFLYEPLQEYRRWLEAEHYEYTYYESAGGHTWPNWQDYICRFMKKIQ